MVRWVMVLVMLLTVMTVPVWAQEWESQFEELPPCETEVLEAYAEEILPHMWIIYFGEPAKVADREWITRAIMNGLFTFDRRMPACSEALWLRDLWMMVTFSLAMQQSILFGDAETASLMGGIADSLVGATFDVVPGFYEDPAELHKRMAEIVDSGGAGRRELALQRLEEVLGPVLE